MFKSLLTPCVHRASAMANQKNSAICEATLAAREPTSHASQQRPIFVTVPSVVNKKREPTSHASQQRPIFVTVPSLINNKNLLSTSHLHCFSTTAVVFVSILFLIYTRQEDETQTTRQHVKQAESFCVSIWVNSQKDTRSRFQTSLAQLNDKQF